MARPPLFIVCANPACRKVKEVRSPYEQRTIKTCSRRCQAVVFNYAARNMTPEDRRRGAERSKVVRRRAAMRALEGLTPVQIYRKAFSAGWHAGVQSARRRQVAA
jgi:hypothetical protein